MSRWRNRLIDATRDFRRGSRRSWKGERLYLEVRLPEDPARHEAFANALRERLEPEPGVGWVRLNPALSRVVVGREVGLIGLDRARLSRLVARVERRFGRAHEPTWRERRPFPADSQPILRFAAETLNDGVAFGAGLGMRLAGVRTAPAQFGVAAAASLLTFVPELREQIEARIGPEATDMALNSAMAFSQAMVKSTDPVVDAFSRILSLRGHAASADLWAEIEPELGEDADAHASEISEAKRPGTLRHGPIEHYSSRVLAATAGAFGFGFATSHDLAQSTVSVFGGVPKPARFGREAFAAELGRQLAKRGVLVMDSEALRRLDRIDCVLVPGELLQPSGARVETIVAVAGFDPRDARRTTMRLLDVAAPDTVQTREGGKWWLGPLARLEPRPAAELLARAEQLRKPGGRILALSHRGQVVALVSLIPMVDPSVEAFAAAVRRAELLLVATGEEIDERGWVRADRYVPGGARSLESLRTLQVDGHGVAWIAARPSPSFSLADVSVGLVEQGQRPPWGASFLCREGINQATLMVEAIAAAREASQQSVYLAMIEAVSGVVLAVGGLRARTLRRVMAASNATSAFAMANGVRLAWSVGGEVGARPVDPTPWHALEVDEVLERLHGSRDGLDEQTAFDRRRPPLPQPSPASHLSQMIVEELANPLAPVLFAGAGLSALTGSAVDAGLISSVVVLNAVLGAVQRDRTARALAALDETSGELARVRRAGQMFELPPEEIVLGDLLVLEAGDAVFADARLVEAKALELDESSLTGESLPVAKHGTPSFAHAVADRTSMVFAGTVVAAGSCAAVVTAVGDETEARRALHGQRAHAPSGVEARLESLTNFTAPIAALSGFALMAAGVSMNQPPAEVIASGVSLAVAAVPEGLPLLATVAQLAAAQRLSSRGAMVRNPRAIEALGRANVLCADKTGTLTEGWIQLRELGDGSSSATVAELADDPDAPLRSVLRTAMRAVPRASMSAMPHATDRALVEGAHQLGVHRSEDLEGFAPVSELAFESARGFHAVHGELQTAGGHVIAVKGAPERVIPRCRFRRSGGEPSALDDAGREALRAASERIASRGLRVLAIAERDIEARERIGDRHVDELCFVGFVAFADPVRASSPGAVERLRRAGVDVIMITGDHPNTARAIAEQLRLFDLIEAAEDAEDAEPGPAIDLVREEPGPALAPEDRIMTGAELDELSDDQLDARIETIVVFARATPSHKVRIVRSLQRCGRVVGMTGDGANDAPAIRLAEVGIALGRRATPAARKVADIVITDDRIETIVDAVFEGRALWRSVRDAVALLVGGNLGEIKFTVFGGLTRGRSPLNARQLLLVNLLTDAVPAMVVAVRHPREALDDPEQLLREGPEASLGEALDRDIAWRSSLTSWATSAAWTSARMSNTKRGANTVALLTLVGAQLGQTLVLGRRDPKVIAAGLGSAAVLVGIIQTPVLSRFFGSRPLGPLGLSQAFAASLAATGAAVVIPKVAPEVRAWAKDKVDELVKKFDDEPDDEDDSEGDEPSTSASA